MDYAGESNGQVSTTELLKQSIEIITVDVNGIGVFLSI